MIEEVGPLQSQGAGDRTLGGEGAAARSVAADRAPVRPPGRPPEMNRGMTAAFEHNVFQLRLHTGPQVKHDKLGIVVVGINNIAISNSVLLIAITTTIAAGAVVLPATTVILEARQQLTKGERPANRIPVCRCRRRPSIGRRDVMIWRLLLLQWEDGTQLGRSVEQTRREHQFR